jgi:hypothetical protein
VIFLLRAFYYDIIDICQDTTANLRDEDFGGHSAKASSGILEPLGHPKVVVSPTRGYEAYFGLVLLLHLDLMIALKWLLHLQGSLVLARGTHPSGMPC